MKVKIRGLVFVGFAAAVFAQSAMADTTTDAKTVTSKLYVDNKIVATDSSNNNATTITQSSPDDKAPSALNVYKFVTGQVEGAAITPAVGSPNGTAYLNFTKSGNTLTVDLDNAPATTAAELTGPLTNDVAGAFTGTNGDKLVTATSVKALIDTESSAGVTTLSDAATGGSTNATVPTSRNVVDYAEKKANKATAIIPTGQTGANSTSDTAYPTTKAVYDFVTTQGGNFQPKVDEAAATTMYVGKYVPADGNTPASATWDKLTTGTYVSNTSATAGTYTLDVPAAKVASATTDFVASNDTNASTKRPKLTTAGAVYDFVKAEGGNYQPKIENTSTGKVMIGYNTATTSGNDTTYSSGWRELVGDYTMQNNVYEGGYIEVAPNPEISNLAQVRLLNVGHGGSAISSATAADATAGKDKLASAYAVKEYVTGLTGGLTIPEPTGDCEYGANGITSTNGVACALVLSYSASANNNAGGVALEWIPMAQTVSSGSSNQQDGS